MSKAVTPRKCSDCGRRRMPAKRSGGRLSTKCKECFGGLFWNTAFGRWFAEATKRQSPDSMPLDENDIKGIYSLWKQRRDSLGFKLVDGKLEPIHEYHISHRDPANGVGFQGRFTTGNLIVATAKANKMAYNAEPIDHGHRVLTTKKPFGTAEKVRQWCGGQYELNAIAEELSLKKYTAPKKHSGNINPDFLPKGKHPRVMLEEQLNRFNGGGTYPWRHTLSNPNQSFLGALSYGIGLGSGQLKDAPDDTQEHTVDDF